MVKIKAVLIDLDGLLVNSEQLYLEANKEYFKQFDINFTEEMHAQGTGRKFDQWMPTLFPQITLSGEELLAGRNLVFFKLVEKKLKLLPGVDEFLQMVSDNFKCALVTSSRADYLEIVFRKTSIKKKFDVIINGGMVEKGKPNPECYLKAASSLGSEPEECLVFEDAPSGILAGKAAGMKVVNIPSPYVKDNPDLKKSDYQLSSMKEVTLEWIQKMEH